MNNTKTRSIKQYVKSDSQTFRGDLFQIGDGKRRTEFQSNEANHAKYVFSSPAAVSVQAQDVLLALLFAAQQQKYPLVDTSGEQDAALKVELENIRFSNRLQNVEIETTPYELARLCGYSRPGECRAAVLSALRELSSIEVEFSHEVEGERTITTHRFFTHFLSWKEEDTRWKATGEPVSQRIFITLNWLSTAALLGLRKNYSLVSLSERAALTGPAKILHAKLSAQLSAGRSWKYALSGLAAMIWATSENPDTQRQHRCRVKKCLGELAAAGWTIEFDGQFATVTKP